MEDPEDGAVGDAWHFERLAELTDGAERASLEERIRIGIEEPPVARRKTHVAMAAAIVDEPEERQQVGPRSVARVHGVGIARLLLAESAEEPGEGVVALIDVAGRHQTAILGVG